MTKLEQLKAAFEAATPGEWDYFIASNADRPNSQVLDSNDDNLLTHSKGITGRAQSDVEFIVLAHNLMPQLLEAVAKLEWIAEFCAEHPEWFGGDDPSDGAENEWLHDTQQFLEKLK